MKKKLIFPSFTWITNISSLSLFLLSPLHCSTIIQHSIYIYHTIFQTIANYLIKKFNFTKSLKKKVSTQISLFICTTSSIKTAKQYIYLPIDSKLETRNSKTFRYLSFFSFPRRKTRRLKFRLRVVVWTISRPLKRLTYDFVGCTHDPGTRFRYSSTRSVVVYTLARKFETFHWTEEKHVYDTVSHRCSFFLSLFLFFTSRSVKVVFTPEQSSKFQNKGFQR